MTFLAGIAGGFDAANRPAKAAIGETTEQAIMASDHVTVRTIRPHDTSEGLRSPGDEYQRSKAEAAQLVAAGVVAIVGTVAKPTRAKGA